MCGSVICCDVRKANKFFELQIRGKLDKCPDCGSKAHLESLIYCSQYDEHLHPDFLDFERIDHSIVYTHAECDGCSLHSDGGLNYEECGFASIKYVYQCNKCGVIFDAEKFKIIKNFEDSHEHMMGEFPFYDKELQQKGQDFSRKIGI
jgi:uncharacterized C2H2 Zn-finger protein